MQTLSIVVPVAAFSEDTIELLGSVARELGGVSGEAIVVHSAGAVAPAPDERFRFIELADPAGFAAAANAGARASTGQVLVVLAATRAAEPGWGRAFATMFDDPDTGLGGARILDATGTLLHAGADLLPARFTVEGFTSAPRVAIARNARAAFVRATCDFVHPACFATPRALFTRLGGLDEELTAGYAVDDYALRIRERGRRVDYQPAAAFTVAGPPLTDADSPRARRRFAERWRERIVLQPNRHASPSGLVLREAIVDGRVQHVRVAVPPITIVVHGTQPPDPEAFAAALSDSQMRAQRVLWAAAGPPPGSLEAVADPAAAARELTEHRADAYTVFVRSDTRLVRDWLNLLVDAVEFSVWTVAATIAESAGGEMPLTVDARCSIVAPRLIPQHVRIEPARGLEDGLADWIARAVSIGRDIRPIHDSGNALGPDAGRDGRPGSLHALLDSAPPPREPFASIVMLSWNAPTYTEMAVESIRQRTRVPHEIILIDNGSDAETRSRLAALHGVRIIYNEVNTGFAYGCNQGIAAARGSHIVLLNNDVIVSEGWVEAMLDLQRRVPTVGISAPRTNHIGGKQKLATVPYTNLTAMQFFAAERAARLRGQWYREDRIVGFCMCIAREVVDEIGGLDPRYGVGNFEDDDYCLRARAAGYELGVCEDSFIHHFGSVSFRTNNIDFDALLARNVAIFRERWGIVENPEGGYNRQLIIARGFDRRTDYVPLPPPGVAAVAAR